MPRHLPWPPTPHATVCTARLTVDDEDRRSITRRAIELGAHRGDASHSYWPSTSQVMVCTACLTVNDENRRCVTRRAIELGAHCRDAIHLDWPSTPHDVVCRRTTTRWRTGLHERVAASRRSALTASRSSGGSHWCRGAPRARSVLQHLEAAAAVTADCKDGLPPPTSSDTSLRATVSASVTSAPGPCIPTRPASALARPRA